MLYVPEEHVTEVITGHTFQTSSDRGVVRLANVVYSAPDFSGQ